MRLGGWTRLAIVLSVIWLGTVGVLVMDDLGLLRGSSASCLQPDCSGLFDDLIPRKEPKLDVVAVLLFTLIPLVGLWVVPPVVVKTFRWVAAGFKKPV